MSIPLQHAHLVKVGSVGRRGNGGGPRVRTETESQAGSVHPAADAEPRRAQGRGMDADRNRPEKSTKVSEVIGHRQGVWRTKVGKECL
jgi:hypothetical protein